MNYKEACKYLEIDTKDDCNEKIIKKQYRVLALIYHPDKNSDKDAAAKFQQIHAAYEYLMKYEGYMDDDIEFANDDDNNDDENQHIPSYISLLYKFMNSLSKEDTNYSIIRPIINKIMEVCEDKAMNTLNDLDKETLLKTYNLLEKYKTAFHYETTFLDKLKNMIKEKTDNDERIILKPVLSDLYQHNVYKLNYHNADYYIPLWHDELIFDTSFNQLYVSCLPDLPDNIEIDDRNNILVSVTYNINDLWNKKTIDLQVGSISVPIVIDNLKLKKSQIIRYCNKGIPKMNSTNVYDVNRISDLIVTLHIVV